MRTILKDILLSVPHDAVIARGRNVLVLERAGKVMLCDARAGDVTVTVNGRSGNYNETDSVSRAWEW